MPSIKIKFTPFTSEIDDPSGLKQNTLVRDPLKTKFSRQPELLRSHLSEFTRRMESTGLILEFLVRITEQTCPLAIALEDWTDEHPLHWTTDFFWKIIVR